MPEDGEIYFMAAEEGDMVEYETRFWPDIQRGKEVIGRITLNQEQIKEIIPRGSRFVC